MRENAYKKRITGLRRTATERSGRLVSEETPFRHSSSVKNYFFIIFLLLLFKVILKLINFKLLF